MQKQIVVGAVSAIVAAVALTILASLWNNVTNGDVVNLLRKLVAVRSEIPAGAVMSFELSKCPEGWVKFDKGSGRFIVGVGSNDQGTQYKLPYEEGQPMHEVGGSDSITLDLSHMPKHSHRVIDPGHTHIGLTTKHEGKRDRGPLNDARSQGYPAEDRHMRFRTTDRDWYGQQYKLDPSAIMNAPTNIQVVEVGMGASLDIRPSYIALQFCKKEE